MERGLATKGQRFAHFPQKICAFFCAWKLGLVLSLLLCGIWAVETDADDKAPISDFSRLQPGEKFPGGKATSKKSVANRDAFSHSSGNIGFEGELNFKVGNGIFRKLWVSAPSSTTSSDGLGPLYNARSCQRCHLKDGRGHPPEANWPDDDAVSMLLRLSIPPQNDDQKKDLADGKINAIPDPVYGGQLQDLSIQGHDAEGKIHINYTEREVELAGGEIVKLRVPEYSIDNLAYGPLHPDIRISPRIAPQMIGLGLLELIPEDQILANSDPTDHDGDGISGRPNRVWSPVLQREALGRFGLKAGAPSIKVQTANAFSGDIGISSEIHSKAYGDCTVRQKNCQNAPSGNSKKDGGVEIGNKLFNLVTFYAQNLAVPKRRNADDPEILKGKEIFYTIGCSSCHQPKFVTGVSKEQPHLSNQLIWPYTDLLLHDMGEGLADHSPEAQANGREWRTSPLWGIGLTKTVNGHTYFLHDGRARSVKEAILWHGGEAEKARNSFAKLPKEDRDRLIAFVNSL